jgi:hypothetical protein
MERIALDQPARGLTLDAREKPLHPPPSAGEVFHQAVLRLLHDGADDGLAAARSRPRPHDLRAVVLSGLAGDPACASALGIAFHALVEATTMLQRP